MTAGVTSEDLKMGSTRTSDDVTAGFIALAPLSLIKIPQRNRTLRHRPAADALLCCGPPVANWVAHTVLALHLPPRPFNTGSAGQQQYELEICSSNIRSEPHIFLFHANKALGVLEITLALAFLRPLHIRLEMMK